MVAAAVVVCYLSLVFFSSTVVVLTQVQEPAVSAMFIFGDSTVDVGTNHYLNESTARADIKFNGIDYRDSQPTGRFSNGYNTADMIARLLGFKRSPPPFFYLVNNRKQYFKRNILQGVNFASGGSGLLDKTGGKYVKVISLGEQIQQFSTVRNNISEVMGEGPGESQVLSRALFLISVGSNDIFEYFNTTTDPNGPEFLNTLISAYQNHLQNLLNLGARKFGIISVPPIGCCPLARLSNNTNDNGCIDELNIFAQVFYKAVGDLMGKLQSEFQGMQYSVGNTYEMTMTVIENPLAFGIKDVTTACCGGGKLNAEIGCQPTANVCTIRDVYLFWDRYHPTQAVSRLASLTLFGGSPRYVTPFNLSHLVTI